MLNVFTTNGSMEYSPYKRSWLNAMEVFLVDIKQCFSYYVLAIIMSRKSPHDATINQLETWINFSYHHF